VAFSAEQEPGAIAPRGRYKGRPTPYGSASLEAAGLDLGSSNAPFFAAVEQLIPACRAAGGAELKLSFWTTDAHGFVLAPALVARLAGCGLGMAVSG
jgi:hypothetical protein